MKVQRASLWLLGAVLTLCSVHTRPLRRCPISMDIRHLEESFQEIKRAIQTKDNFQNVTILSTLGALQNIKPLDVCCVTKNLLAFYVDRVFKDHQELNPQSLRKVSSIANSFLYMQRTLQQCQVQRQCRCSQEATNATQIIHDNYDQHPDGPSCHGILCAVTTQRFSSRCRSRNGAACLEVPTAAIKSLGELNVFLAWIDKNHQETSAAQHEEPV